MKITKYKKTNKNTYKITLDNYEEIKLYEDVILEHSLLLKKEITKQELTKIIKTNQEYEAYYKAIRLLTTKLRTRKELSKSLSIYSKDIIEKTIKKLEKLNYLDDYKYLKAYLNDQVNLTNKGPLKIKRELIELELDPHLIENEISLIDNSVWQQKITTYINKKIKTNYKDSSSVLKYKLQNNLINLGYQKENIIEEINKININDNQVLEKEYYRQKQKLSRKYQNKELETAVIKKLLTKGYQYHEIKNIKKED